MIFSHQTQKLVISSMIALASLGLAYFPIPGLETRIIVVSGTELAEPLEELQKEFEKQYPNIAVEIKTQGSQDIINNLIDKKNDFKPTVIIPSNNDLLTEFKDRYSAQKQDDPFYETPQPIAKTMLVGIAWPERGKILFPDGIFRWERIEQAMLAKNWQKIGGQSDWGSFDFLMTDPTRSNSGQITLALWSQTKGNNLNDPKVISLLETVKKSVYLPPRSTDILLQEFIARGSNEADVATVYESIALYRQKQSGAGREKPYQIYYLNPTIETTATAAIIRQDVSSQQAKAASQFIDFLRQKEQQKLLIRYGFRPVVTGIPIQSVSDSPWSQNILGSRVNPSVTILQPPDSKRLGEIQRLWNRVN